MKPKLTIPPRKPRTPEQIALASEMNMISELYIRWTTGKLLPTDDFLMIKYIDRLEHIREQENFHMRHINWKVDQMNLNNPKEEGHN